MKKTNIIKLVAAALAVSVSSGMANAVALDLDATSPVALKLASEAVIATAGTTVTLGTAVAADQTTTYKTGVAIGANTAAQLFVRFTLGGGAKFVTAPTLATTGTAGTTVTSKLGGAGSNFVVFQIDTAAAAMTTASVVTLTQADISLVSQAAVPMTAASFATLNAANPANTTAVALNTKSSNKLVFSTSLSVKKDAAVTPTKIDVASGSAKFVGGGLSTVIGDPIVDVIAGTVNVAGNATAYATSVAAGTKVVIKGDFTASQDLNAAGTAGKGTYTTLANVVLDSNGCTTANGTITSATALTATSASFTLGATPITAATEVCMTVNGKTPIVKGSYTMDFTPTAATGYKPVAVTGVALSTLAKNGTTRTVLNIPSSTVAASKKAFVRITNTSSQAGLVIATLYNEAGTAILTNAQLTASLAANGTFVLGAGNATGAAGALEALGAATWTGRAVLVIDSETSSLEVQALVTNLGTGSVQTNLSASSK